MKTITQILQESKIVAVVGLSNKPDKPSHEVAEYLQENGYRVVPVNPTYAGQQVLGETVYASVKDAADALASHGQRIDIVTASAARTTSRRWPRMPSPRAPAACGCSLASRTGRPPTWRVPPASKS